MAMEQAKRRAEVATVAEQPSYQVLAFDDVVAGLGIRLPSRHPPPMGAAAASRPAATASQHERAARHAIKVGCK